MSRTLWQQWGRVVLAGAAITAAVSAWGAMQDPRPRMPAADFCQSNLKQLSLGLMMYTEDYDETYPPAGKWSTLVQPYVKITQAWNCPADPGRPSYAMNQNLSGGATTDVTSPVSVVMLFESNFHRPNASGTVEAVARPPRHLRVNNYAFVDGHVREFGKPPSFGKKLTPRKRPQPRRRIRRR